MFETFYVRDVILHIASATMSLTDYNIILVCNYKHTDNLTDKPIEVKCKLCIH